MTLREQITEKIRAAIPAATPEQANQAAVATIEFLDDAGLSLSGNGWLDDDPVFSNESENEKE